MLAEVARVLAPGGLLIMSTPERQAYSDERDFVNPFHERELTQEEFAALLRSRFATVSLFAQRAVTGSRIEAADGAARRDHLAVRIERSGRRVAARPRPARAAVPRRRRLGRRAAGAAGGVEPARLRARADRRAPGDGRDLAAASCATEREELVAAHARAQRAEDEAKRVQESVAWRLLERIRRTVYGVIGEDSAIGRGVRRAMHRLFRAMR